jgi:hypothetical protein
MIVLIALLYMTCGYFIGEMVNQVNELRGFDEEDVRLKMVFLWIFFCVGCLAEATLKRWRYRVWAITWEEAMQASFKKAQDYQKSKDGVLD